MEIIKSIYKDYVEYPLEYYISTLIFRFSLPPRGFYQVSLKLGSCLNISNISQPPINELPLLDIDFSVLPKHFSLENTFIILNTILLERNVLFVCNDISIITPLSESIITLMFPFDQQFVYIPVLPKVMIDFLGSPVPYIVGIKEDLLESAMEIISGGTCIANIDKNIVYFREKREDEDDLEEIILLPKYEIDNAIKKAGDDW